MCEYECVCQKDLIKAIAYCQHVGQNCKVKDDFNKEYLKLGNEQNQLQKKIENLEKERKALHD